jgi:NodT family efflux transporter outer membrane factor (OMF) lipoprotein
MAKDNRELDADIHECGGVVGDSFAGYEYQADVSVWLALDLDLDYRSVDIYTIKTFPCENGFMPFTTKRQAISLAADEKQRLESLRRSRTGAKRQVLHAGILLDLAAGMSDGAAASSNGVNRQAQASAADRETARLSLHAELAVDYFDLRSADTQEQLLADTVKAYKEALQLTQDRYDGGAAPLSDVTQARAQWQAAQVAMTDVRVQRAGYEHAIAVLTGKPPAEVTLAALPMSEHPPKLPAVPGLLPAQLLERRPDIAAEERRMAAANEEIGIAQAAFYPTLSLSAVAGFAGTSPVNWLTWPSRLWAVGPTLTQTLFDHGLRRASSDIARANYDATVAAYRQSALSAFQQVEDNLAALRELETEAGQQHVETESSEQSLDLFKTRYEGGVDTYLQVITWQTAALQNERNDIDILRRRLEADVLLIKALGGGWNASGLPHV